MPGRCAGRSLEYQHEIFIRVSFRKAGLVVGLPMFSHIY